MKLLLVAAILCLVPLLAQGACDNDWAKFKNRHGKNYKNAAEEGKRRAHFEATHAKVVDHNTRAAAGLESYTKAHNHLSDMSPEEKKALLGHIRSNSSTANVRQFVDMDRQALPQMYDLRTSSCLPAIKNQGNCGDCYVFASVDPIEYQYCLKKNNNVSVLLSVQQGTDCTYPGRDGCQGGDHHDVFDYIYKAGGLQLASTYPFTSGTSGVSGTCKFTSTKAVAKLSGTTVDIPVDETALQSALVKNGPITVAMHVTDNFMNYASGVFTDTTCKSDLYSLNHEMTVVGYGVSADTASFLTPYWIVRNQWTTQWGVNGYAYVKRGVNMCGIATEASYPTVV